MITLGLIVAAVGLGLDGKPTTAEAYYQMYQGSLLVAFIRDDFSSLIIIALYLGLFLGLYGALRRSQPALMTLASALLLIGVTAGFATHSGLSLFHLSQQYAAAVSAEQRAQLVAAGEAVLATNMWNSSGGYLAGILLQGYGVIVSLIMLRSPRFSKVTAYAGLLSNGLDLLQHLIHPFAPALVEPILRVAGPFYLIWFPMLARDLFRLAQHAAQTVKQMAYA